MRRTLLGTWRRKALTATGALVLVSSAAAAGFILYSGANGSGQGTFAGGTNSPAITITGTSQPELDQGGQADLNVTVTNNDPDAAHSLTNLDGTTFSTTPAECAAHMAVATATIIGSYAAGETRNGTVTIGTLPDIPSTCAGGTWTINFGGTTTTP
jgi:hypothetical protein